MILKTAKEVLQLEADAILKIGDSLDHNFTNTVTAILECEGRLVVCGIGKSAAIAQKIVATFNSTGQQSLFLHAADAIHGDLGMLDKKDLVLCISKSGDTPEIKVLVPIIKRLTSGLIALVSNTDSYLAKNANHILAATIEKEAGTLNLAPTTSTTAALALGDALAVCLLEQKGFTSEDFAKFHPGGSLGKKLYLKVEDIYPQHELPMVFMNSPIQEIIIEISKKRIGATAVVDKNQELLGVITDGDLRRMLTKNTNFNDLTAKDIMTENPITLEKGEFAVKALYLMQNKNISQLIISDKNKVVGFVHLHDLLKEGLV